MPANIYRPLQEIKPLERCSSALKERENMNTKTEAIYDTDLEKVTVIDPPYTVFGHSVLMPEFSITMRVDGLKKMLSLANDDDSFKITIYDKKMTEYAIIKKKAAPKESEEAVEQPATKV